MAPTTLPNGPWQVQSSLPLPHKSSNLRDRANAAWASVPNNAAHVYGIAYATAYSAMQSKPEDELTNGFGRSRVNGNSVSQQFSAEQYVPLLHYPQAAQRPMNIGFTSASDRILAYREIRPVGAGTFASSTWGM